MILDIFRSKFSAYIFVPFLFFKFGKLMVFFGYSKFVDSALVIQEV